MKNDCDWYIFKQSTLFNVKNLTEAKNRTIIFLSWIPWVTKRIFVSIHVRQPHNFRRYMIVFCASCVSIVLLRSISRSIRLNQLVIIPKRAHETLFDCFKRRILTWKKLIYSTKYWFQNESYFIQSFKIFIFAECINPIEI